MATDSHTHTFDQTQETPASAVNHPLRRRVLIRDVLEATASHFKTTVPDMLARSRKRRVVRRRQVAQYVARRLTGRSLPYIADRMGGYDHTTVLSNIRAVQGRIDAGRAGTIKAVDAIVAQLTGGARD